MSNNTESEVDRDVGQKDGQAHNLPTEFLDDTDDTHALMFGIWRGVRSLSPKPQYKESVQNPHYFMLGYLIGWAIKLAVIVALGREYLF